jgi:hypothetical protein
LLQLHKFIVLFLKLFSKSLELQAKQQQMLSSVDNEEYISQEIFHEEDELYDL